MRLTEIEKKAKNVGIDATWKFDRKELIQLIQEREGSQICFGTRKKSCTETTCCWRADCIK